MKYQFTVNATSSNARAGSLIFTDGTLIQTPVFMPVGTQGSIKSLEHSELYDVGYRLILGNTYHLYLRPGTSILDKYNGLSNFMSWKHRILTDSGGYQAFSLSKMSKYTDDGVIFRSHIDGSSHYFTPEKTLEIQKSIGSDIVMPIDDCAPYPSDKYRLEIGLKRTHQWFDRSFKYFSDNNLWDKQTLFPIIQGGIDVSMRQKSAHYFAEYANKYNEINGFAIGGLSVGEKNQEMLLALQATIEILPQSKPRYLMGVGAVVDIFNAVESGVDMFDCVLPTRNARNGQLFTSTGKINIRNEIYKDDTSPIDSKCLCATCTNYSRGYLRHLHKAKEILAYTLSTRHNLYFMFTLMQEIRQSIIDGNFQNLKKHYFELYDK